MKKLRIDRFEGEYAICENEEKTMLTIPRVALPANAKEGDCLIQTNGTYRIDPVARKELEKHIRDKMNRLFK